MDEGLKRKGTGVIVLKLHKTASDEISILMIHGCAKNMTILEQIKSINAPQLKPLNEIKIKLISVKIRLDFSSTQYLF